MSDSSEESLAARVLAAADELYGLVLADFTPARDARVKSAKGDPELVAQLKALRKPSVAAWVVDLLVRHETEQVAQVLIVGEALRDAQASMSADELRALTRQRRQLTAAVTTRAGALAFRHGHRVSDAVGDQVEATLTAAMVDASCAAAVRSGLLVTALTATGVPDTDRAAAAAAVALPEALGFTASAATGAAGSTTGSGKGKAPAPSGRAGLRVVPDPDAERKAASRARDAAQAALDAAEGELAEAAEQQESAATRVRDLEAHSLEIQAQLTELHTRLAELESEAEELGDAEDTRGAAEAVLSRATEARDAARASLDALPEIPAE